MHVCGALRMSPHSALQGARSEVVNCTQWYAETTNNKRLRSTFCIEAIHYRHEASRGVFATAELLVSSSSTSNVTLVLLLLKMSGL